MIAYLEGAVRATMPEQRTAVINAGGVGYLVHLVEPIALEEHVELWIHSVTKETGTTLYAFPARGDRDAFAKMLGVTNVGPKIAMLALRSGEDLWNAQRLAAVKGLGQERAAAIAELFGGMQ